MRIGIIRGGAVGAGIIGIRVAVRGVFAAIARIHRVDDGVDELVDPGVQRVGILGHLFGDVDYRHIGTTGSASDHIGRVTGFLRVVNQHIHALVFDEFLERLQVRGGRFAAGSGRLRIPLGRLILEPEIGHQIIDHGFGGCIGEAGVGSGELGRPCFQRFLVRLPCLEPLLEGLLLAGECLYICIGDGRGHAGSSVFGEPQMRVIAFHGTHDGSGGYDIRGLGHRFGGPGIVARTVGHDDLCLGQLGDVRGLWLEIVGIHIGGVHDGRDFHIIAAQLGGQRAPLIEGGDHIDRPGRCGNTGRVVRLGFSGGGGCARGGREQQNGAQAGCGESRKSCDLSPHGTPSS